MLWDSSSYNNSVLLEMGREDETLSVTRVVIVIVYYGFNYNKTTGNINQQTSTIRIHTTC